MYRSPSVCVCLSDCGTICAPSLMAVVGQYVHWAGKAGRRMPRLLCYWLMLVVSSLKCNSWTINLANLGRHAHLTRCFSAAAELLSSAAAEKQRVSCACLPRLANWLCNALNNADVPRDPPTAHTVPLQHQRRCTYRPTTVCQSVGLVGVVGD